jgi:hypothetical protein
VQPLLGESLDGAWLQSVPDLLLRRRFRAPPVAAGPRPPEASLESGRAKGTSARET